MKFSITIIEDETDAKEQLLAALSCWQEKNNADLQVEYFCSAENYFASCPQDKSVLYILDIQLHGMTGIETAKNMRARGYKGTILFLTSFREFVFDGYDVKALNYLLKPVKQAALDKCLDDVYRQLHGDSFIYRNGGTIIHIPFSQILSFSAIKHYTDITTTENVYSYRIPLGNLLAHLPEEFVQCHRSYIVNMYHISKIAGLVLTLSNKTTVPIGRNYLDNVRDQYADFTMRLDV